MPDTARRGTGTNVSEKRIFRLLLVLSFTFFCNMVMNSVLRGMLRQLA